MSHVLMAVSGKVVLRESFYSEHFIWKPRTGESHLLSLSLSLSCFLIHTYVHAHAHTVLVVLYILWQLCGKGLWVWPEKQKEAKIEKSCLVAMTPLGQFKSLSRSCETSHYTHLHISVCSLIRLLFHSVSLFWFYFAVIFLWNRGHVERKAVNVTYQSGGVHIAEMQGEEMELSNTQHPIYFCSLSSGLLSSQPDRDYLCLCTCVCVCVFSCVCMHVYGLIVN